jgi:TatD DNase family protein
MIDCHLHLQDPRLADFLRGIMETVRSLGIRRLVVNGTGPRDWDAVKHLAATYPEVLPSFGLHPWKVGTETEGWLADLEDRLLSHPAAGVGEIGLDRWIRGHDLERQKAVFLAQLELAERLDRSVSIHCLQAWGSLLEILTEHPPRTGILLHSYGGPAEMVEDFVALGAWFSISGYFFRPDKAGKLAVFDQVPHDRLLVETDAPDMALPHDVQRYFLEADSKISTPSSLNHPANLIVVYEATAARLGMTRGELEDLVSSNFSRWWPALARTDQLTATSSASESFSIP